MAAVNKLTRLNHTLFRHFCQKADLNLRLMSITFWKIVFRFNSGSKKRKLEVKSGFNVLLKRPKFVTWSVSRICHLTQFVGANLGQREKAGWRMMMGLKCCFPSLTGQSRRRNDAPPNKKYSFSFFRHFSASSEPKLRQSCCFVLSRFRLKCLIMDEEKMPV